MRIPAVAVCVCACVFAQSPTDIFEKAPPQTEKSLRERIDKFFAAHAAGKFRQAEEVIHEDSKDIFYDSQKTKIISWETVRITWLDNYTKAVAITNVEMDWHNSRIGKLRVKPPMKSLWKLDNGEWWWYAEQKPNWETPFGTMNPGADPKSEVASIPKWTVRDVGDLVKQVVVSRDDVRLSGYQPSEDNIEITNRMPADLDLHIDKATFPPGLDVQISKNRLASNESAKVTFKYQPPNASVKPDYIVEILAVQTNQSYPVRIRFAAQPEIERNLPRTQ
jgi:hypothetical protein